MIRQYQNCGDNIRSDLYSKFQCQDRKSSASSTASTSSSGSNQSICPKLTQVSRQVLANALEKNWNENFGNQTGFDESLTNLNWLHNVNPIKINEQLSFTPFVGYPKDTADTQMYQTRNLQVYPNQSQQWPQHPTSNFAPKTQELPSPYNQPDYKNNPNLKPPFSYAILISWAMKELRKPKITLSDIYSWIIENFAYYRHADSSWQNSIRHNLSLGKCFEKVPRRKDEPGKGGFWRISPLHSRILDLSLSKIKYNPSIQQNNSSKPENSFTTPRSTTQMSTSSDTLYSSHSTSTPVVKKSRKSPLTVTQEDWDSQDVFNTESSVNFDDMATYNNNTAGGFDLSPFDTSSSDSNNYGPSSCDQDISLNNFNNDHSLESILSSPMLLDKEDLIEHDDFRLLTSNNEFSDFYFSSKDDLQELDCLLGIF